ncbi:hypothetical protein F5B19DRAFT_487664 [Rostrohypoxylon terebratum]|nr:hypothetical protein F5B19DRAFT_487664 [Rostrohypoxylon terebratum]
MIIDNILARHEFADLWSPATVTAYDGSQVVDTESRFCGRIFYTSKYLAGHLLGHVLPLLPPEIITLKDAPSVTSQYPVIRKETWHICRLDNKMHFLEYGPGQYFKPHYDDHFTDKDGAQSFLTLHLEELKGGATRFAVNFEDPHAGKRDQRDMYHEEATVAKRARYTMRTDVMYGRV